MVPLSLMMKRVNVSVIIQELNISGCSRGELIGSSLLLHCSSRCHNLHSLNVSWCQISIKALELVLEANQGYIGSLHFLYSVLRPM